LINADIVWKSKLPVLPGHFCSAQQWDLLVMNKGKLIASIKFGSLVSTSFAKNRNGGCNAALSIAMELQARDFWREQKTFCGLFEPP
jgi:hypothetical protein